ncbi:nicolin-1-like isoform X2 [Uloborus diversus]|uniref:nicolin-1-like isoform X2 n=1 Tax=Uloborus diversus TaxID=327109 RepID=UPI0024099B63|nr:nicolin-1-like isoform X2 [Uloborus diversus]
MLIEEDRKTLEFKARPVTSIFLDDERADYKPGCSVLEVSFPEPVSIDEVRFRNNYTAYIKMSCKRVPAEKDVKNRDILPWQTSVRHFNLMPEPECEKCSQDIFSLLAKESLISWSGIVSLRIILKQPSFRWKKFGIEELSFFGDSTKEKSENITGKSRYMWTITDLMKDKQPTSVAVGRFEVDGSYDVAHLV